MAPAIYCASLLFTSYLWKGHFTKSSGLGNKMDAGAIHQGRVQEERCLGTSAWNWVWSWGGEAWAVGPNREQLVRPQVWRTSLGVDMESEKKRQPGQSPGEHQLMRNSSWQGASKGDRRSCQRGRRENQSQVWDVLSVSLWSLVFQQSCHSFLLPKEIPSHFNPFPVTPSTRQVPIYPASLSLNASSSMKPLPALQTDSRVPHTLPPQKFDAASLGKSYQYRNHLHISLPVTMSPMEGWDPVFSPL